MAYTVTVKNILDTVCDEVGIPRPPQYYGVTSDLTATQMLALLNAEGRRQIKEFDWNILINTALFTTVVAQQTYAVPVNFERFVDDTQWNTTAKIPLFGPTNRQRWAANYWGTINSSPYYNFEMYQGSIALSPTPTVAGVVFGYSYVSSEWISPGASSGTARPAQISYSPSILLDSDMPILDWKLLLAGVKWRWLRAKGLAYDEERDEYDRMNLQQRGNDHGARQLSMDPGRETFAQKFGTVVPYSGFGS